ncbi:MAG: hypothetical protein HYZ58_19575 [Acidobacteria bacterium]|nr:hypothetical protein [Acidobacteriota bacterium]MBI3265335.1 hypothetical protein [Acidobacteriota bacterium]
MLAIAAAGLVGVLVFLAGARSPRDEQRIQTQFDDLATDLSVTGHETDLVQAARASRLRRYFLEEVQIDLGEEDASIDGLSALIATAAKFEIPSGGIQVAFVDVRIKIEKDQAHANAVTTVRATRVSPADGKREVDAREMIFTLERRSEFWMISRVAPVDTLERVGESASGGS